MPFHVGKLKIYKDKHHLYQRLNNYLVLQAALNSALNAYTGRDPIFKNGEYTGIAAKLNDIDVMLPIQGPIELAMKGVRPEFIEIEFRRKVPTPYVFSPWAAGVQSDGQSTNAFHVMAMNISTPFFVEFYEHYKTAIEKQFVQRDSWPVIWQFAAIIRNSISHNGRVWITSKKAKPVTWYGLTYSVKNHDISTPLSRDPRMTTADLWLGDLLILLFEMAEKLEKAGCPI
jgi:hypothetical protein